jgi:hypothetical protein
VCCAVKYDEFSFPMEVYERCDVGHNNDFFLLQCLSIDLTLITHVCLCLLDDVVKLVCEDMDKI